MTTDPRCSIFHQLSMTLYRWVTASGEYYVTFYKRNGHCLTRDSLLSVNFKLFSLVRHWLLLSIIRNIFHEMIRKSQRPTLVVKLQRDCVFEAHLLFYVSAAQASQHDPVWNQVFSRFSYLSLIIAIFILSLKADALQLSRKLSRRKN